LEEAAKEFAMALNCIAPDKDGNPCYRCADCIKMDNGSHPDLYRIEPDGSSIKIAQIREMQKVLYYSPYQGKWRVFVLSQADKLTDQAANSLLKTLEEPIPQMVFILLASNQKAIPATILSRCQIIYFGSGQGNTEVQDAHELLEVFFGRELSLSVEGLDELEKLSKEQLQQSISFLFVWLRDLLVFKGTGDLSLLQVNPQLLNKYSEYALDYRQAVAVLEKLNQSLRQLEQNVNKRLVLDSLFFETKEFTASLMKEA
jgi:DNA polymerase-3 subunit delta'